jgi:hypothetical protein
VRQGEIKTFRFGDAFIILFLALGTATSFISRHGAGKGDAVLLTAGDGQTRRYSLSMDTVLTVDGPAGKTGVRIHGGQVWISGASCPLQVCRHQGKIRLNGQILVCVPNRIVIEVEGSGDRGVDATTE